MTNKEAGAVLNLASARTVKERRQALYNLLASIKADPSTVAQLQKLFEECDLAEQQDRQMRPLPLASMISGYLKDIIPTGVAPVLTAAQREIVDEWVSGWKRSVDLRAAGLTPPGGLLIHGPTGTGKSTLADSLATRLEIKGVRLDAHQVLESFMGKTGENLIQAFNALTLSGNLAVIEEIDALGEHRTVERLKDGAAQEGNRITIALLRLIENPYFPLVATTNRIDVLGPRPAPALRVHIGIARTQ